MAGGVELHFFQALIFQISEPEFWHKAALSSEFQGLSCKIQPLKNAFQGRKTIHRRKKSIWKTLLPF